MEESKSILLAMAGSAATSRFVGRAAELGRLEAAFGYVGGGEPATVCVGGEAGVGKTRLVTQFAGQVRGSGGRVLLGGCIELAEASLPYAPVVEALRGLGRGLEPATLDELVGPGRPMLARLLPEFGQDEESTGPPLAVGSSAQARLFEAFLAVLERLADRSPAVLIVEDLHWADRSTLGPAHVPRPQPAGSAASRPDATATTSYTAASPATVPGRIWTGAAGSNVSS